jgi:CBS domain containing-hemolysin-like protein
MKLVYILLALALLKSIFLYKVYNSVPSHELKRRARSGDRRAAALYKVAVFQPALNIIFWLTGTAAAVILVIWSANTNIWLAAGVVIVTAWLLIWAKFSVDSWAGRLTASFTPLSLWIVTLLNPLAKLLAKLFPSTAKVHTDLYEKKDLLELLTKQNKQVDNRIEEIDLKIAHSAMTFGDKTVGSIMTPQRQVKVVGTNDTVGPLLMDELHKSGFSRFPVVKDTHKTAALEVVGTLYLNDLIGYEGNGKVKDLAKRKVYFINEDCNLRQSLNAFLRTHHHLLIVVNSFEEMVGIITLEDVLEQIIGKQIIDEFDNYENMRAVASMNAKKDQAEHEEVKPEQTPQTVVE